MIDSLGRQNGFGDGRPPALSPRLTHTIAALIRAGVPVPEAARALGVADTTWSRWMRHGRAVDGLTPNAARYRELVRAVEFARAERKQQVERMVSEARRRVAAPSVQLAAARDRRGSRQHARSPEAL